MQHWLLGLQLQPKPPRGSLQCSPIHQANYSGYILLHDICSFIILWSHHYIGFSHCCCTSLLLQTNHSAGGATDQADHSILLGDAATVPLPPLSTTTTTIKRCREMAHYFPVLPFCLEIKLLSRPTIQR